MSKPEHFKFVNDSQNDLEKRKRIEILKTQFEKQSNFASFAFAAVEDNGNESGIYDDFADFNKAAKAESALFDIKRIVARHSVADSIKQFVLKRNMEAQKKKEKAKQNNNVSRPFWY